VKEAAVLVREDERGEKRLLAFVTPSDSERPPGAAELRDFLKEKLPDYMIPSGYAVLDSMPVTAHGKVDRQALALVEVAAERPTVPFVPPQNEEESLISQVWREVLCLEQVGIDDNFFDIGGHSLRLVDANLKLKELLGRDIPIMEMFRFPTIRALAEYLRGEQAGKPAVEEAHERALARRTSLDRRRSKRQSLTAPENSLGDSP
jgi:acyl carrier protein